DQKAAATEGDKRCQHRLGFAGAGGHDNRCRLLIQAPMHSNRMKSADLGGAQATLCDVALLIPHFTAVGELPLPTAVNVFCNLVPSFCLDFGRKALNRPVPNPRCLAVLAQSQYA